MKKSINTYLPVFSGFYGSYWEEPDFYGEAEHFNLPAKFPFYDYMNWRDYRNAISERITDLVETELKKAGFVKSIKYESLSSPKEYNFMNDSINCEIVPVKKNIKKFIYENKEEFEQYLKDHLKSRDGFISFHSWLFEDWEQETKKFTDYSDKQGFNLGFILEFICECGSGNETFEQELNNGWLYEGTQDVYPSQFLNDEFDKITEFLQGDNIEFVDKEWMNKFLEREDLSEISPFIEKIQKYVQENYTDLDFKSKAMDKFTTEAEELDLENVVYIEAVIDSTVTKIESNTLKLDLK